MYCKNCGHEMNANQAVCLNCGVAAGTGNGYCYNCGKPVSEEAVFCVNCGVSLKKEQTYQNNVNTNGIQERSIVKAIIFSLLTCGIYGIYWFISLTNEMNRAAGKPNDTTGGMAFIFTLLTCGIYGYFWAYKLGEKRDIIANEKGSSNVVYLLLTIFGVGILVYILAQDTLNKAIKNN